MAITVAAGVEVPDVTWKSFEDAREILVTAGLEAVMGEAADCGRDPGQVCGQEPAPGTRVPKGTTVTLTVQK